MAMKGRFKMERITEKMLKGSIDYLNKITGQPATPYTKIGDKFTANIGNYHLDCAYGGYQLAQIVTEGGGIRTITSGFCPKRELYYQIRAYIEGIEEGSGQSK
jgi:hypothetical protein